MLNTGQSRLMQLRMFSNPLIAYEDTLILQLGATTLLSDVTI